MTCPPPLPTEEPCAYIVAEQSHVTNPKSIAYFLSIFGAVEANRLPPALQFVAVFGLPAIGFAWYVALALTISHPRIARSYFDAKAAIELGAGALITALGLRMIFLAD